MQVAHRCTGVVLTLTAGLSLAACRGGTAEAAAKIAPAHVEHIDGSELSRITLTAKAAERLDIQTAVVREARVTRSTTPRKVVPYAAVLYDANGNTWVYTSPESLVFLRHKIGVDYIEGDVAVLTAGPPNGTQVVTTGAAELFGAEFEIGH
jgi:hypothetical protein